MKIEIVEVKSKKTLNAFVEVPWNVYKNHDNWVPPLRMAVKELFSTKHPVYETLRMRSWVALLDNKPIGRISAIINQKHNDFHQESVGFFGFFECIENFELTNALFKKAYYYFAKNKVEIVRGPVNPSSNYELGCLVDSFDDSPRIMMTYNPSYYADFFEKLGFKKAKDLLALNIDLSFEMPEVIKKIAARAEKSKKVSYRSVRKKDWKQEIQTLHDIYNNAWEKNWGFVPMTKDEFLHTAKDLKTIIDEQLITIVEVDGEAAGFILALPDMNQVFAKIPNGKLLPFGIFKLLNSKKHINRCRVITLGVKTKFRKMGLETLLYQKQHDILKYKTNYTHTEMSWILEDNQNMIKPLLKMGADVYKTYRIYERSFR